MKKLIFFSLALSSFLFGQSATEIIDANGCLACHAVASKKMAPAFAGIAKRNLRFEGSNAKSTIMASIKNGSKGKYPHFASSQMPPYANLTQDELNTIADYILAQASKAPKGMGHGMGKGGMR